MDFRYKSNVSSGINETFDSKIKRLENLPMKTFAEDYLLTSNEKEKKSLHIDYIMI